MRSARNTVPLPISQSGLRMAGLLKNGNGASLLKAKSSAEFVSDINRCKNAALKQCVSRTEPITIAIFVIVTDISLKKFRGASFFKAIFRIRRTVLIKICASDKHACRTAGKLLPALPIVAHATAISCSMTERPLNTVRG